ncbi:MAG: NAD-dependent epimerase/dehydratase family protein [Actinobacteria bacterium]|nr:MAG: NAD-dependent epimerase/dehydratase family protein [Actinomycetota bacterium]
MFAIVVGGGRVGSYLAKQLVTDGHKVTIVEQREDVAAKDAKEVPEASIVQGDGCDPEQLELAGANQADLVAAVTGHDEDNLVICQLSKYTFNVGRVVSRINNPKNEWLYNKQWGVDVAVSAVHIISKIIQEEATLGDIVTLLKLKEGKVTLVELVLNEKSKAVGKKIMELPLPPEKALIAAILREGTIIVPKGDTVLAAGDEVLALTSVAKEKDIKEALS